MKATAAVLGALVGLLIVAGVGFLMFRHPSGATAPIQPAQAADSSSTSPPRPDQPLQAPLSREAQLRADLDRQRAPYFHFLASQFGDQIERVMMREDYDTLDLVVSASDNATLTGLIQRAVAPTARDYGFRKVRFYAHVQDPTHPYQLIAEAAPDDTGRWNIFRK